MKQKNTTTQQAYEVTERTRKFLDAVAAIAEAKDAVCEAMTDMYGEFNTEFEKIPFEAVENVFAEYMYIGIAENMTCTPEAEQRGIITI